MSTPYRLEPDPDDQRKVRVWYEPRDGLFINLMAWEALWHLNRLGNGWYPVRGKESDWAPIAGGGFRRTTETLDGVRAAAELVPYEHGVAITVTAGNHTRETDHVFWGAYDIRDFWGAVCLGFRHLPRFCDPAFERTYISVNGRPTALKETDLSATYRQCLPAYWVSGQRPRLARLPESEHNYGSGISATEADASWIGVESADGRHCLIGGFPRVHHLWANRRPPNHACIHPQVMLGDIPIDGSAAAAGLVTVAEGGIQDAAASWREAMQRAGATLEHAE
jgi:hypothetical protein